MRLWEALCKAEDTQRSCAKKQMSYSSTRNNTKDITEMAVNSRRQQLDAHGIATDMLGVYQIRLRQFDTEHGVPAYYIRSSCSNNCDLGQLEPLRQQRGLSTTSTKGATTTGRSGQPEQSTNREKPPLCDVR